MWEKRQSDGATKRRRGRNNEADERVRCSRDASGIRHFAMGTCGRSDRATERRSDEGGGIMKRMSVCVVTGTRAEFGILRWEHVGEATERRSDEATKGEE